MVSDHFTDPHGVFVDSDGFLCMSAVTVMWLCFNFSNYFLSKKEKDEYIVKQ